MTSEVEALFNQYTYTYKKYIATYRKFFFFFKKVYMINDCYILIISNKYKF